MSDLNGSTSTSTPSAPEAVQSSSWADIRSPRHPSNRTDVEGVTSGATERLKAASVLTNEAWSPRGTPDQSESVSAVGSGSSSNDEIFRALPLSHETSSREIPADNNNEERYGFIS